MHLVLEKVEKSEIRESSLHSNKEDLSLFDELSASLVSFWESQTIYASVKLGVFDVVKDKGSFIYEIVEECNISEEGTLRLVRALCSIGLLKFKDNKVWLTKKGSFLVKSHELSLSSAALMWNEEHYDIWNRTYLAVMRGKEIFRHCSTL